MTPSISSMVRLSSLLTVCAVFVLGTASAHAADAKKKDKTGAPTTAPKPRPEPKKMRKAPPATPAAQRPSPAGHDHAAHGHGHAGHDHKGHDHAGHGHGQKAHGHPGGAHPPHGHGGSPTGGRPSMSAPELQKRAKTLAVAKSKKGPVVAEQRKHALRNARLMRLMQISMLTQDPTMATTVGTLLDKEKKRHYKKMRLLRKTMRFQAKAAQLPFTGK